MDRDEVLAETIHDLSTRIDDALSFLDWASSTDEIPIEHIEQLYKILEGRMEEIHQ